MQVANLRQGFANNLLVNTRLLTQLSKMIQSGGFPGKL